VLNCGPTYSLRANHSEVVSSANPDSGLTRTTPWLLKFCGRSSRALQKSTQALADFPDQTEPCAARLHSLLPRTSNPWLSESHNEG